MKIYLSGVMQGSIKGHGIEEQGYRQVIIDAVKVLHSKVEIYDPLTVFPGGAEFDDRQSKQALFEMADEAASSDFVIAYLPKASMGTALEMVRAFDSGKPIISISTLEENWFIKAISTKIFSSLDEFCSWIHQNHLTELDVVPGE